METIQLPIAIRAYSERPDREPLGAKSPKADGEAPRWTLVFDCETAIDATQQLRFEFYQVRDGDEPHEEGLFYDPHAISQRELGVVRRYAKSRSLKLMRAEEFRSKVYVKYAYTRGGTVVGFNLPFDTSRIAIGHGSARYHIHGGFSFVLTHQREDPRTGSST